MKVRGAKLSAPLALAVAADRNRRLGEGSLVQASVQARLLGLPLLRLDATVVLLPAEVTATSIALPVGSGLDEAVRDINEGAEVLAGVRGRRLVDWGP